MSFPALGSHAVLEKNCICTIKGARESRAELEKCSLTFPRDFGFRSRLTLPCQSETKKMVRYCLHPSVADSCNFINRFFPVVNTTIVKAAGSVKSSRGNSIFWSGSRKAVSLKLWRIQACITEQGYSVLMGVWTPLGSSTLWNK